MIMVLHTVVGHFQKRVTVKAEEMYMKRNHYLMIVCYSLNKKGAGLDQVHYEGT